jgi:putative phage-type endonuclease
MTEDLIQRSDEWKAARVGSLGASCVHEVVARTKSGYSASRANRLAAMVIERLTGRAQEMFVNQAMQHGIDMEPEARDAYAFVKNADVVEVGLVKHPKIIGSHASPDGLVGDDKLLEIKCPQAAAHLSTLLGDPIPEKYVTQMLWQMACTGRAFCDFASYNADFPVHLRLKVIRVVRNDARIAELEREVSLFLNDVEAAVKRLTDATAPAAA